MYYKVFYTHRVMIGTEPFERRYSQLIEAESKEQAQDRLYTTLRKDRLPNEDITVTNVVQMRIEEMTP